MPQLIKLACPGCGESLAEDNLHNNVLHCPYCDNYTYYDRGMFNSNVFFGLIRSQNYDFESLKKAVFDKLLSEGDPMTLLKKVKHIKMERFLVPVREFGDSTTRRYAPMLEVDAETVKKAPELHQLLKQYGDRINHMFEMQFLTPLRIEAIKDVVSRSGQIYRTHLLPTTSKLPMDEAYQIKSDDLLRVLYVPVFRLSFNNKLPYVVCLGNDKLTGLERLFWKAKRNTSFDWDNLIEYRYQLSYFLAFIGTIALFFGSTSNNVMGYVVFGIIEYLVIFTISLLLITVLRSILPLITTLGKSALTVWRDSIVRRTLERRFGL